VQGGFQAYFEKNLIKAVEKIMPIGPFVHVADMLERCDDYIHHDYDGDPPLSIGTVSILSEDHISGVMNILPFTCLPGTLNCAVSGLFRKDHKNIPWENFAYDGQVDASFESRLQAFMHQAKEYATREKRHQSAE
jgi:predicted nucleotide-binding protein (sugar kinase/HSP70/actin superfamily)